MHNLKAMGWKTEVLGSLLGQCGISTVAVRDSSKVETPVRFRYPAPESNSVREFARAKSDLAFIYINISFSKVRLCIYMERFYVYTLLSLLDKKFYTGFTTNLKQRLQQHARGEVKSTKNRRPVKLIHYEYFVDKGDAEAREKFLKSGFGRQQIRLALRQTLNRFKIDNI